MGEMIQLTAKDGFTFGAYQARPSGTPKGGLVVIQEIFGVNEHIRNVVDRYAGEGYATIAPAIYDRAEPGFDVGYGPDEAKRGVALRGEVGTDNMLLDIDATRDKLSADGKVAIVGYCLGGSLAWFSACRVPGFNAAIGYYGGMIAANASETPNCPVMLHFGEADHGISMEDVDKIRAETTGKDVQIFTYPGAGHAFNRDGNQAHHEESAKLALSRTLDFLKANVG